MKKKHFPHPVSTAQSTSARDAVRVIHALSAVSVLSAALISGESVHAQTTPPDAGRTLRELQTQPPAPPPRQAPTLVVPADAAASAESGLRFPVSQVRIEGNTLIATEQLRPFVAGIEGRDASLGELREAAARITALYRQRGYIVARAYVPAQQIAGGVVQLSVLEGTLNDTGIENRTSLLDPVLRAIVSEQQLRGKPVQAAALDRELLLIADLPAVGAVAGNLKPGAQVGDSDLFITADAGKPVQGQVVLDNYGNRYTGQTRLNGAIDINSPLGIGDRLSLRGTATDEELLYGQVAYDLPINSDGLRLGTVLSSSSYNLGREFGNLDAGGTAHTAGIYTTYPLQRGLTSNVWLRASLNRRQLKDEIRAVALVTDKSATVGTVEASGDLVDAWGGGAYTAWRASASAGKLQIDTPSALQADQAGPKSSGGYRKFEASASRLQAITPRNSALVSIAAQWAGKNLDSSEKFVLGGMYGVRAYPQGEGVGDEGWIANVEWRQDLPAGLQASLFYDHGRVRFSHAAFAAGPNELSLKGYGVALGARYGQVDVKATVAWRNGQLAQSAPDRSPRLWLLARWMF